MQAQNISPSGSVVGPQLLIRPEIAPAVVRILKQDGQDDTYGLIGTVQAGEPIDLGAPRSLEAAAFDGQSATTAGYLLALIRDRFLTRDLGDWDEFVALGALAADVQAALAADADA